MKKKLLALLLCAVLLCTSVVSPVFAAPARDVSEAQTCAGKLKELGLFKGVSDSDFDLERAPSRVEALVMLIRVLGCEQEAQDGVWQHPFTDVPAWADHYVGFAYENGLSNGISSTEFGVQPASAKMYLTFMLRALGYSDEGGLDFSWNDPYALARRIGILPDDADLQDFWRADAVLVSYSALPVLLKDGSQTLAEKLMDSGCFTQEEYAAVYENASDLPQSSGSEPLPDEPYDDAPEEEDEPPLVASSNFHGKYYTGGENSKCYHYEPDCAGKYSHEISRAEAMRLKPCSKCVLH